MIENKVVIRQIQGSEVNILNAESSSVKLNKTGFFLCEEGDVRLTIDGVEYTMHEHSLIVYFSYSELHIIEHSSNLKGTLIGADLEMLQPLLYQVTNFNAIFIIKQHPLQELCCTQYENLTKYIDLYVNASQKIIQKPIEGSKPNFTLSVLAEKQAELLAYSLILEVIECYAYLDIEASHHSRRDEVLQKFVSMLYRKYRTEHEVAYYANKLCLTSRYFSAIIKEKSGKSPSQWIATALLVDAKNLLTDTNMSIKEVSELLNFPNQSYFGKWFKNLTGVGPLDFRYGNAPSILQDKEFTDVIERGLTHFNQ